MHRRLLKVSTQAGQVPPFRYRRSSNSSSPRCSIRANLGHGRRARTREEAARQQGGLFFRENSSNGGKAIRTFWLHTKFGPNRCQGQNLAIATY
jgi:hypothetical protein